MTSYMYDDFFQFFSTSTDYENVESFDDIFEGEISPELFGLEIREETFVPISPIENAILALTCVLLSIILNSFIVRFYYYHSKSANRPYVLALVALDWTAVVFVVFPRFLIAVVKSHLAFIILDWIYFGFAFVVFGSYLIPSFYLAVDRFLAVWFPHKFQVLARKARPIKIAFLTSQFTVCVAHVLAEVISGMNSSVSLPLKAVAWLLLAVQLFGSVGLYSAIVVRLILAHQRLGASKHSRCSTCMCRINVHLRCFIYFKSTVYVQCTCTCLKPFRRDQKTNRQHMKSIKIGVGLMVLTIITYLPVGIRQSGVQVAEYFRYFVFVNNFANFFIYLAVDENFKNFILRRK